MPYSSFSLKLSQTCAFLLICHTLGLHPYLARFSLAIILVPFIVPEAFFSPLNHCDALQLLEQFFPSRDREPPSSLYLSLLTLQASLIFQLPLGAS